MGDGRAAVSGGDERSPWQFRAMVDEILTNESPAAVGRYISREERELRAALGVK